MIATIDALLERLSQEVRRAGSQEQLARRFNISPQYLCDVLKRRREPGEKLLRAMGYRKIVIYEQMKVG